MPFGFGLTPVAAQAPGTISPPWLELTPPVVVEEEDAAEGGGTSTLQHLLGFVVDLGVIENSLFFCCEAM